jgi:hypothetical protein
MSAGRTKLGKPVPVPGVAKQLEQQQSFTTEMFATMAPQHKGSLQKTNECEFREGPARDVGDQTRVKLAAPSEPNTRVELQCMLCGMARQARKALVGELRPRTIQRASSIRPASIPWATMSADCY